MDKQKIGVGMIGNPQGGEWSEVSESGHYAAGCDVDAEKCRTAREKFKVKTFTDYRDLIMQDDIDVVMVRTPNHFHKEPAIAALTAGKHVFCEKPLALSMEDCMEMAQTAKKSGRLLQINLELRSSLLPARVKEIVENGEIGSINRILFHHYQGAWDHPSDHWRLNLGTSGGIYPEKLVHEVDLFRWFAGEFSAVQSFTGKNAIPQSPFPDCLQSIFWFRNGALGYMLHTQTRSAMNVNPSLYPECGHEQWIDIFGSEGSLRADFWKGMLEIYSLDEGKYPGNKIAIFKRREDYSCLGQNTFAHDIATHFNKFLSRVAAGGKELQPLDDVLKTMHATFAAEESVRTGEKTEISDEDFSV